MARSPFPSDAPAPRLTGNALGIAWLLFSVVTASAMSLAVRELSSDIDSRMIVLLRATVTTAAILAILPFARFRIALRFSQPWAHVGRGVLVGLSTHLGFYTLAEIPIATATVLFFTAPIFAALLSVALNGETIGPRRIGAIVAGFIGAVVILRPGFDGFHPAMLAALGSSLLFALALSMSRRLATADGAAATFVSSTVVTFLVSLPIAAPVLALPQGGYMWAIALVMVASAACRSIGDIQAYRYAEAAILAPVTYLRLILIGIGGYVFWAEVPDGPTWVGAAIIVGATFYIVRREARARRLNA